MDDRSHHRSLDHVRGALATLARVLLDNRRLGSRYPRHQASADRRIAEAEQEIIQLESEQGALESEQRSHGPSDRR